MSVSNMAGVVLLACASLASAQGFGGNGNGGYNGYGNPNNNGGFGNNFATFLSGKQKIVIAHAVLASAAFVFFFPVGAILIRLGNFRGLWLVHAAIQAFAYLLYIAAFGIGVYMSSHIGVTDQAHPIIGIVIFILLLFQPVLGLLHHLMFKKHSKRVIWSYGHIWLGRIVITLGIINGGLGLQLAQRLRFFAPSTGAIIAYSVVAAVMWLIYVLSAIIGEVRRGRVSKRGPPPPYMQSGAREHHKEQQTAEVYS